MKEFFRDKNFRESTLVLIETCNDIITDYQAQGYSLTLRQLYYQLVSRDIVENTERSYKSVGKTISDARPAGARVMSEMLRRIEYGRRTLINEFRHVPRAVINLTVPQGFELLNELFESPFCPVKDMQELQRIIVQLDIEAMKKMLSGSTVYGMSINVFDLVEIVPTTNWMIK